MSKIKVTNRTSAEIDALFEAEFKDIKPEPIKPITQADRLAPYRKAIMKQRRRGLTWKQIAAIMSAPRIGERVTEKVLIRVFATPAPVPEAPAPGPVPPKPPVHRLILDPATGKPVT